MTYTGGWFFKWQIIWLFLLAAFAVDRYFNADHLMYGGSPPEHSTGLLILYWFAKLSWFGILLVHVFRTYNSGFYFITDDNGNLTIRNALWPLPIAQFKAVEIEKACFKKTGMFGYKLQITSCGKTSRWFGNNSLEVSQWQALVDDLKAHGITVEVNNLAYA